MKTKTEAKKKTTKKRPRRPKHFWTTRDNAAGEKSPYNVHCLKPPPNAYGAVRPHEWELKHHDDAFCPEAFERFADRSVHLEPGGGSIKAMIVRAP